MDLFGESLGFLGVYLNTIYTCLKSIQFVLYNVQDINRKLAKRCSRAKTIGYRYVNNQNI